MTAPTHDEPADSPAENKNFGGMYEQFETNDDLETRGVDLDYGDFRVTIARAGGANKKFARVLEARTKPLRRAIATETINNDRANEVLMQVYAETIVLRWDTKVFTHAKPDGEFKPGIEPKEGGKLLVVTPENIVATFKALPDLFRDIQEQANRVSLFREMVLEDDAGN